MRKNHILDFLSLLCVLLFVANFVNGQIQDDNKLRKYEIEAHFTDLNLDDFNVVNEYYRTKGIDTRLLLQPQKEVGFGIRAGYNINKYIAVEAEANLLPRFTNLSISDNFFKRGGIKAQFLVGAKIGKKLKIKEKEKFGFFGKIRPGFIRFDRFARIRLIQEIPPNTSVISTPRVAAFFNLDVGGVVEYYPTKRTFIRADFGDTIIHYGKPGDSSFRPLNPTFTTHNFQTSIGFGFRF